MVRTLPAGHAAQPTRPNSCSELSVPELQTRQGVSGLASSSTASPAQGWHLMRPLLVLEAVVPTGHSPGRHVGHAVHRVAGSRSQSRSPASHAMHCVALAGEYVPTGHGAQGLAGSLSESLLPAAHSTHVVPPTAAAPARQASHGVLASRSRSADPPLHAAQRTDPVGACVPAGHGEHASLP